MSRRRRRKVREASRPTAHNDQHGEYPDSVVCRHLFEQVGLRYYYFGPTECCPFPKAWCQECHSVLESEGGWSRRALAYADPRSPCPSCFREVISHHRRVEFQF